MRGCVLLYSTPLCVPAAGDDYTALPATDLMFDASISQVCVDITIQPDDSLESVEDFTVSATTDGLASPVTATVFIIDSTSMCTTPVVM